MLHLILMFVNVVDRSGSSGFFFPIYVSSVSADYRQDFSFPIDLLLLQIN